MLMGLPRFGTPPIGGKIFFFMAPTTLVGAFPTVFAEIWRASGESASNTVRA
jgi:hypothetical protein